MATVETHLRDGTAEAFSVLNQDEFETLIRLVRRLEGNLAELAGADT